jgi:hypothetical protein
MNKIVGWAPSLANRRDRRGLVRLCIQGWPIEAQGVRSGVHGPSGPITLWLLCWASSSP